jgi:hypothetical protein
MKARTSNRPSCNTRAGYAYGGIVETKIRDIGGVKARPYGHNPNVIDDAMRGDEGTMTKKGGK